MHWKQSAVKNLNIIASKHKFSHHVLSPRNKNKLRKCQV